MVKLVVFSVLVLLLAMQRPINAFGTVRVDIQKDNNGLAFANAIGTAISQKIQSVNSILNSFWQAKASYGTASVSSSSTGSANLAPIYQKVVRVNSGYAATAPPTRRVADKVDAHEDDKDNEVTPVIPASEGSASTVGRTVLTVNKSVVGIPAVSVSTSPVASGSASVDATASVPSSIGYQYRKRYV